MEKVTARTGIYHEHQQGALCAQHALNNLLQSEVFLADSLADIARELDVEESSVLRNASRQSENMDDTGFFNIQVLQRALKIFEIELVPFGSQEPIAQQARRTPESIQAYICNLGLHWFAVRRFANQYFNLNSMFYVPEIIPIPMLTHYLNIIKENRYSVFIVQGTLPECLADQQLRANPITRQEYLLLTQDLPKLIMDGEVMGGPNDKMRNGGPIVSVPRELYIEYRKNPNNPEIRAKMQAALPKGFVLDSMAEAVSYTNPYHHHQQHEHQQHSPTAATPVIERRTVQQIVEYDCVDCNKRHAIISEHVEERLISDTNTNEMHESHYGQQTIRDERKIDDLNLSLAQNRLGTGALLMARRRGNPLMNNPPNRKIENEEDFLLQQAMARSLLDESDANEEAHTSLINEQTEEIYQRLIDRAMAESLITGEVEKIMELTHEFDKTIKEIRELGNKIEQTSDMRERREQIREYQKKTERVFELEDKMQQTHESLLATTRNAKLAATQMSSSSPPLLPLPSSTETTTAAHSSPSASTDVPLPTNTYSPSPNASLSVPPNTPSSLPTSASIESSTTIPLPSSTKTDSSLPVLVNPPTPTTTDSIPITTELPLSTKTDSSLPVVVNPPTPTITDSTPASPNVVESPSVEELRLRHLQNTGRRHRSIISVQSNSDD